LFVTPPNVLQLYELSAASSSICQIIFICHSMSTLYQYEDVINNQLYDGTGINCKLDQLQSKLRRHYAKTIGGRLDSSFSLKGASFTRPSYIFMYLATVFQLKLQFIASWWKKKSIISCTFGRRCKFVQQLNVG